MKKAPKQMTVKIVGINAIRVVPYGQHTAVEKKKGETVEVEGTVGQLLIAHNRAEEVKSSKDAEPESGKKK